MVKIPIAASLVFLQFSFLFQTSFGLPVPTQQHCKRVVDATLVTFGVVAGIAGICVAYEVACHCKQRPPDEEHGGIPLQDLPPHRPSHSNARTVAPRPDRPPPSSSGENARTVPPQPGRPPSSWSGSTASTAFDQQNHPTRV